MVLKLMTIKSTICSHSRKIQVGMSRRREPRVEINLEVKVWGLDRHGKPFVQNARTLDATRLGLRLLGVDCVKVGETVGVQHGQQKSRFKVVWIGRENTPKQGQIGLHNLEPDRELFSLRPVRINGSHSTQPGFDAPKKAAPARRDMQSSRRKHPRYLCTGGVELRLPEGGPPAWGNLNDISLTGCYVETASTLPLGAMVLFHVHAHDLSITGRAIVKTSHHIVGMGLAFLHLENDSQHNLEFLIGSLAGQQEMLPEEKRTFIPADPPPAYASIPSYEDEAASDQPQENPLAAQILRLITELNDLEQHLVKEKIDPRLIAQFHDAMEHTRQTAWTVQQWVDLRSTNGDPFIVLPQLEAERMHMLTKLAHNVVADLDSEGINEFSEGVGELYETVQQLHSRLNRMLGRDDE